MKPTVDFSYEELCTLRDLCVNKLRELAEEDDGEIKEFDFEDPTWRISPVLDKVEEKISLWMEIYKVWRSLDKNRRNATPPDFWRDR